MSVLVVLEQRGGKWNRQSFEALAVGQRMAEAASTNLQAVAMGGSVDALAREAAAYGADTVIALEHPLLNEYTPDGYTAALEQQIRDINPTTVVFPHTYQVRDFGPKLATRLGQPFVSDVVDIRVESGHPVFVRQLFQGKMNADVEGAGAPALLSVQAGAFRAAQAGSSASPIERFEAKIDPGQVRSRPEAPFREGQRSIDLGAAEMIVSVGRGIGEKENLGLVEQLAEALGAELAASRPICDSGWLPMERQVGSSGQTVSPKVYVAVGISGAIQHLVGMKGSKTVVAINKDESAPIFESADYGIVGDLFEVLPALIEEIKKVKA
jgi:electron transfer flavoprotein alpha subunit